MGTIINLYLFPKGPRASRPSSARLGAALLAEGYVAPPLVIGAPERDGRHALVTPQAAANGWADGAFNRHARLIEAEDAALTALRAASAAGAAPEAGPLAPTIFAFARLNENHPAARRDFEMYDGYECAVAAYVFPEGRRLRFLGEADLLTGEEEAPRRDGVETDWLHFQGKSAPWTEVYRASELSGFVERFWPGHEAFEECWP